MDTPGGAIGGPEQVPEEVAHLFCRELPEAAACRELFEETGYRAREGPIKLFSTAGTSAIQQKVYYFLARDLYKSDEQPPHTSEQVRVPEVPWKIALALAVRAEFADPGCAPAIILTETYRLVRDRQGTIIYSVVPEDEE